MFPTGLRAECFDCLRILRRDRVAESCYPECYTCPHVRIEYGKRVLIEPPSALKALIVSNAPSEVLNAQSVQNGVSFRDVAGHDMGLGGRTDSETDKELE